MIRHSRLNFETGPVLWGATAHVVVGIPLAVLAGTGWVLNAAVLAGIVSGLRTTSSGPRAINGATAAVLGFLVFVPVFAYGYLHGLSGELSTGDVIFFTAVYSGIVTVGLGIAAGLIGYIVALLSGPIRKRLR